MITINGIPVKAWSGVGMIYLATPYNHPSAKVRNARFKIACRIAAFLMREGIFLFCPIAHTHPIAEEGELPKGWDYWQAYDRKMLYRCTELWVAMMEGWDKSEGIRGEVEIAQELGIPIVRFDPLEVLEPK